MTDAGITGDYASIIGMEKDGTRQAFRDPRVEPAAAIPSNPRITVCGESHRLASVSA